MRTRIAVASIVLGLLASNQAVAQSAMVSSIDSRPNFETPEWVGMSVHSKLDGRKLLCTLRNRDETSQSILMSWDGEHLTVSVSQRAAPSASQPVLVSLQGAPVTSEGGKVMTLRTVSGVTLGGENALSQLRGRNQLDIAVNGDPEPISISLQGIDSALERLATCYDAS